MEINEACKSKFMYPVARRECIVDDYHGQKVNDK